MNKVAIIILCIFISVFSFAVGCMSGQRDTVSKAKYEAMLAETEARKDYIEVIEEYIPDSVRESTALITLRKKFE